MDGSAPFYPMSERPLGIIMYTPDGYMSAQLSKVTLIPTLSSVEKKLDGILERLDRLEKRLDHIDKRLPHKGQNGQKQPERNQKVDQVNQSLEANAGRSGLLVYRRGPTVGGLQEAGGGDGDESKSREGMRSHDDDRSRHFLLGVLSLLKMPRWPILVETP